MHNFKFNFLSRGQLESLSPDTFFSRLFKTLPCYEVFFWYLYFCHYCSNVLGRSSYNTLEYLLLLYPLIHYASEKFEDAAIIGDFGFVFEVNSRAEKSPDYFSKSTVFKKFSFRATCKSQSRRFEIPLV